MRLGGDAAAVDSEYYFDNFDVDTVQIGCGVNTPPAAVADSASTFPDTLVTIDVLANDFDADGDPLTVDAVTQGSDGTVTINPDDTVDYDPDPGFTGTDQFTYDVSDGTELSTGTVTVTVDATYTPPNADNVTASGGEDSVIAWTPSVSGGGGPLSCSITSGPSEGSASVAADCTSGTYTPPQDFHGADSFTYTVDDGTQTEAGRTDVTVNSTNDAPVAQNDSASTLVETPIAIDVLANDNDVDTTDATLSLASTYESISVYLTFQNDDNTNNSATMEYREAGGSWKPGMELTVDRRTLVTHASKTYTNTFFNQYRGSIVGLTPGTQYEVRALLDDPDGVMGTNPVSATISTRIETDQIPSTGTTYYVSPAGSDTTGDGSELNPWKTIQHAANNVSAGDTVEVKAGTYPEKVVVTTSGTSGNYVTFRNFGTDVVTIQPPGDPSSLSTNGIAMNASYVRITGFRIEGGHTGIRIAEDSTNVIVEDNFITGVSSNGIDIRLGTSLVAPTSDDHTNVENITVQNNTVELTIPQIGDDHGGIESTSYNEGGHVIRNNTVRFLYVGDGTHGEDCIFHQQNSSYSDSFKDTDIHGNLCEGATDDGIELDGNNVNTRVWDNVIVGSNVGFSVGASAVGPTYVFRNVVYDLAYHWSNCQGIKEGRNGSGPVYFYHNTFYLTSAACEAHSPLGAGSGDIIADSAGDPSTNLTLKNNVFHFADLGIKVAQTAPNDLTADYNLYYDENAGSFARYGASTYNDLTSLTAATGLEPNGLTGLPLFVDAAGGDFHLAGGSPGIDVGQVIIGFNDPTSAWSYGDAGPDVGAFETGIPTPDPGTYVPFTDQTAVPAASLNTTGLDLTLVGVTQAASGTVVINADGTVTYTPSAGFEGIDSFTYDLPRSGQA